MLVIATAAFGVAVPHQLAGLVLSLFLVAAAMLGIGVLISALSPTGRLGNAVGATLFFPLMFFAGLWVPRAQLPQLLRSISDFTPLGAGVRAVQDSIGGHWPATESLLVLVAYAAITGVLAVRLFRWQ
jgi:ABC-2 type transport system permease protein